MIRVGVCRDTLGKVLLSEKDVIGFSTVQGTSLSQFEQVIFSDCFLMVLVFVGTGAFEQR